MSRTAHPRPAGAKKHRPGTKAFADALLKAVTAAPGRTIPELAEEAQCPQNQLYRVLPAMQKDGLVEKHGRGWWPA